MTVIDICRTREEQLREQNTFSRGDYVFIRDGDWATLNAYKGKSTKVTIPARTALCLFLVRKLLF